MLTKRKCKEVLFVVSLLFLLYFLGAFHHFFEKDYHTEFRYPYDGDIEESVLQLRSNLTPDITPINRYYFKYYSDCKEKCKDISNLRLVYLIKSAPENFQQRLAIRRSWGYERRFSDVEIRRVFLLAEFKSNGIQRLLEREKGKYGDIVQGNFTDSYFNNTLKTMLGFDWVRNYCSNSRFYMFVDDDYYVSTKNVLRFIRNPLNYPNYLQGRSLKQLEFDLEDTIRLYAGFGFHSSPQRHRLSKWYVSLEEYPYHLWPPYITAGAYILSKEAILDMYYASFYTKHFKFDDIYVGLLALKAKIEPFHCNDFCYYKLKYNPKSYQFVIASHGFQNPDELLSVWTEQKSIGNA